MSNLQPLEFKECVIDSPCFREKLLLHESEIDNSVKVFKDIYNSIKNVYKTLEDCSVAFKELADNLKKFTSSGKSCDSGATDTQVETEDEKKIRNAVEMYSDLISNIESMRRDHILGATKDVVMKDLHLLKEDCLSRSKQDIKDFKKTTTNYYMKLDKYSAIKYKPDTDYDNVDKEFCEDRRDYVTKALTHVMNIQETEEQKTCKLVHTLSLLIQMLNTYHHQAWDHFGDQKKKIDDVNCALFRTEESYSSIAQNTEKLKTQLLSIPTEHIQPDPKTVGVTRREGYLFVLIKKAVMSDMWYKKFCVYEKNNQTLLLIQVQNNGTKMVSEQYHVIGCDRKKSSSVERRFVFDVKLKNEPLPLTLQALTKEDLNQWLLIMDGKEPIYAQPRDLYVSQEPQTILNDKVLRFLSMCFSEIEKRGIDENGLYRTSGRAVQRDLLLKKIIADVNNTSTDVSSDRELEAIEINTLCSLVKAYIKYLKTPMATFVLYEEFISAGKLQSTQERFNAVLKVIRKLPPDHLQLFTIVIRHLHRVTEHQDKNLMTAPNLGVCFSPTIFRPEQDNASLTAIREAKFSADVISLLIERCDDFFPGGDHAGERTFLSPSKSMYITKNERMDVKKSPDSSKARLERINSQLNDCSPKTGLRRQQTHAGAVESKPGIIKPPILGPKPDLTKSSPQISTKNTYLDNRSKQIDVGNIRRSLLKAKTLYVFVAENEGQLSFDPNKIVTNVLESEDVGWLVGNIDGRVGLIPKSYVEMLPS